MQKERTRKKESTKEIKERKNKEGKTMEIRKDILLLYIHDIVKC